MSCHAPVVIITVITRKSKHLFYVVLYYTITHVLDIHGCRISIIYLSGSIVEMCVKWRAAADDVFSVVWKMGFQSAAVRRINLNSNCEPGGMEGKYLFKVPLEVTNMEHLSVSPLNRII